MHDSSTKRDRHVIVIVQCTVGTLFRDGVLGNEAGWAIGSLVSATA